VGGALAFPASRYVGTAFTGAPGSPGTTAGVALLLLAAALVATRAMAPGPDRPDLADTILPYLNRLSDLLFVMARHANDKGEADVLWVPGANR